MRHPFAMLLSALVTPLIACAESDPGSVQPPPPAVCSPTNSVSGGPITDPNGPWGHQVVVSSTVNGTTISGAHQVLDHASVPDGVHLDDGRTLIYYVNANDGGISIAEVAGNGVVLRGAISIGGVTNPAGVVDPDATRLPDGRVRLAYLSGFGPPVAGAPRAICIADADDGMHFVVRSAAFEFITNAQITDPSLVRLTDGTWLLAMSQGQQTIIARSTAGLTFTDEATLGYGGVPELALLADGSVRLYVCKQGIESYRSTDNGRNWTREGTVVSPGFNGKNIVCDPSYVAEAGLFIFKTGG